MHKRLLFLAMGLAALLSACGAKATPTLTATASPTIPPSPTVTATQPAPTDTPAAISSSVEVPAGCSTYSFIPTPDATLLEMFPPSQAGDWAQGPETASITILEYSDFQ